MGVGGRNMLNINELRRQHRDLLLRVTDLRGLGDMVKTREDAMEARASIEAMDQVVVGHLTTVDDHVYPALLASPDRAVAAMAADCAEEVGGILGAWIAYRDRWVAEVILADPVRFGAATAGVVGAIALRIERENIELYPAVEAIVSRETSCCDSTLTQAIELRRVREGGP